VIRKALAMGADEAVVLFGPAFADSDGFATARILAQAVQKGRQIRPHPLRTPAADWDQGIVGSALAEFLGVRWSPGPRPSKPLTGRLRSSGSCQRVRNLRGGPAGADHDEQRIRPGPDSLGLGIIKAAKKPIRRGALPGGSGPRGVGKAGARNSLVKLFIPSYQRKCEMVTGETPAEAAAKLAEKIGGFKA